MRSIRSLVLFLPLALAASSAFAGELVVNDVAIGKVELTVRGLEGVQLDKCASLRIGPNGEVRISCPGYNLRASGSEKKAPDEKAASDGPLPTRIEKRYWLVTEGPAAGAPVDVELYLNGRLLRVKAAEAGGALDVTGRLVPGRNTVVLSARRSASVRGGESAGAKVRVLLGAGEKPPSGTVRFDDTVLDVSLGEADTAAGPRALDFVAR
jgi:hypothetical protein